MKNHVPFGMQKLDNTTATERGYDVYPERWDYDPKAQTTNLLLMGKSSPTTYSQVASTGLFNNDGDEGSDDTGTD